MPLTETELATIGRAVEAAREKKDWSKEEAARVAGISSITWKRVEDGLPVMAAKLRAVEAAFGWPEGTAARIAAGEDAPVESPTATSERSDSAHAAEEHRYQGWVQALITRLGLLPREQQLKVSRYVDALALGYDFPDEVMFGSSTAPDDRHMDIAEEVAGRPDSERDSSAIGQDSPTSRR